MKANKLIFAVIFLVNLLVFTADFANGEEQGPLLDLPVELVGFPLIIAAVRISNFVKKLAYSVNPRTYIGRRKREIEAPEDLIDVDQAEKQIVAEFGEKVCIYPKVCSHHANKSRKTGGRTYNVDWEDILSHYKSPSQKNKEFYLLSAFLGDIIGSTNFCNQLAKRGRVCTD